MQHSNPLLSADVDVRTVANVIADWTGVPLSSLMKDEQTGLLTLENEIGKRVVGQDVALTAIAQRLRAAKTGLTSENGPQGVFLLVGPSGVGKTETALALADVCTAAKSPHYDQSFRIPGAAHGFSVERLTAGLRRLWPGRHPDRSRAQAPVQRGAAG
jgi:ATP-dependent Clp protease ATP-binding subunit ClpA